MLQLKQKNQSKIPMQLFLFYFYGATYVTIEVFFRGHSHWTMFLLGAMCGLIIGALNEKISWEMPFELQCIVGAVVITLGEFIFGYILNIKLGLNIWDYSDSCKNPFLAYYFMFFNVVHPYNFNSLLYVLIAISLILLSLLYP